MAGSMLAPVMTAIQAFSGSRLAESLGLALKGENFIWELTWVRMVKYWSYYPGAKVFRSHPDTGFRKCNGAVKEGKITRGYRSTRRRTCSTWS